MDERDDDDALAIREPAPPVRMASSLETADHRSMVHVDSQGRVRSPGRFYALQGVVMGTLGLAAVATPVMYGLTMGPVGAAVGLLVTFAAGRALTQIRQTQRAVQFIVEDRLDESQVVWERLLARRFAGKLVKAQALQNLGVIAMLRGDHAQALRFHDEAHAMRNERARKQLMGLMGSYARVLLNINLGNVDEAERILHAIPPPSGDYLALQHHSAELYLAFARGKHSVDADTLHARAHTALTVTNADALLTLCAWGFLQLGDDDQAMHLVREALDRQQFSRLRRTLPPLHAWLMSKASAARAGDVEST